MGAEEKLKFTCNKNDCDTWAGGKYKQWQQTKTIN